MDLARETSMKRGGGPASVSNIISGSGTGGINFWGGDLDFVGGNVPESVGSACGIPQTYDKAEGKTSEGRDLDKQGSHKGVQVSGNLDTGVYIDKRQAAVVDWLALRPILEICDRETG